jgi:threonine dehydrogenase-like Zn-dependent dehydrogenase
MNASEPCNEEFFAMQALVLEDIRHLAVRTIPRPFAGDHQVLLRVDAVGVCGTDFHIYEGHANYNLDARGLPIPLAAQFQILGHEFCGTVEAIGNKVRRFVPGDRVIVDQVLNCISQGRRPICEFCATGDSHQCLHGKELGITGIPGAFSELIAVPETNIIRVPTTISPLRAALVEPLGCVLHASRRVESAATRYALDTGTIKSILILGAGPAGLLFLQYLRRVRGFDGQILVADQQQGRLELARSLGGTPIDCRHSPELQTLEATAGRGVEYLIEATGHGGVFDWIPRVARRQATLLLYGAGHTGLRDGCLTPFQVMEFAIVTSCGASGGFDADGTPAIYREAMDYIHDDRINVDCLVTHRYEDLTGLKRAFDEDRASSDFIKAALVRNSAGGLP